MIWLTVKQVADLLNITARGVRKAISDGKYAFYYDYGVGRGGKVMKVSLDSLPKEAQAKYRNETSPPKEDVMSYFARTTGKQREAADLKGWVVKEYQHSGLKMDAFIERYNEENPPKRPIDALNRHKLLRWQNKMNKSDGDPAVLVDLRGSYNAGKSRIADEAWEYFLNLYLRQEKPPFKRCYEFTKRKYPDVPLISAFKKRYGREVPKYQEIYHREGEKAFNDKLPSMMQCRQAIG